MEVVLGPIQSPALRAAEDKLANLSTDQKKAFCKVFGYPVPDYARAEHYLRFLGSSPEFQQWPAHVDQFVSLRVYLSI